MPKRKRALPTPRVIYTVGEPVVVMPLPDLERIYEHLLSIANEERLTIQERAVLKEDHKKVVQHVRDEVRASRRYYHINSSHTIKKPKADDSV